MSPDRQLLLACCHAHTRPPQLEPLVRSAVDWDRLLERAERLGVAAFLRTTLTRFADRTRPPADVLRRLDQVYYQQAIRNARLGTSLQEILVTLSRHGVPTIVLKGAALAELVYGNIALRPMVDLDVLVQPRELDLAERLLRELGYVPDEGRQPAEWYRRHHHHLVPYRSSDGSSYVEVHHHIFPSETGIQVPLEDLWRRARPAALGPAPAMILAPADLLLHLCVGLSAVEHFEGGLRTLCDIAAAIERYEMELEWPSLLESGRTYDLERHLYYGLWLARYLVGAEVPPNVLDQLSHSIRGGWVAARAVKGLIRSAVFQHAGDRSVPAALVRRLLAELLAPKRERATVGGLLRPARVGLRRLPGRFGTTVRTSLDRATRLLSSP